RYARLQASPLPAARGPAGGVLVTLTSLPSRMDLLKLTLASLLDQTVLPQRVQVCLPRASLREGCGYRLPDFLDHPRVRVLRCDTDWGPATKLLPSWVESGPEQLLLAVDDDNVYPPDLVETLLRWHRLRPDAVVGLRGWRVGSPFARTEILFGTRQRHLSRVDVLTGTWGYLLRRDHLDERVLDYSGWPRDAFFVDDVWICGHLARRGVPRLLVPATSPPFSTRAAWVNDLGRRENSSGERDDRVAAAFARFW
ncbi:MAG: hypothetical protein AB1758_33705, partial [Candidatus Eremiobacterota bacterium]